MERPAPYRKCTRPFSPIRKYDVSSRHRGVADHAKGISHRSRRLVDRCGCLDRRTGYRARCRRGGGTAPGGRRGLHGRAGRCRVDGVRAAVRGVPRAAVGRGGIAAAAGGGLPERLGGANDGRAVRVRAGRDAARSRGLAQRSGLPEPGGVPPGRERRPAGRRAADGGRGGHDRRRGGRGRGAAGGAGRRAAPAAAVAVRQPGGAARTDPGHRRAARGSAAGRLAELAPDARQPRLQSAGAGDARQRRRAAVGLGAVGPGGKPPDDAAGARRRDVPGQPGERGAGDRRGQRRRHLAVPVAAAGGCGAGRHPHPGPLRRQGLPGHLRRGPRRARRADRRRGVAHRQGGLHAGVHAVRRTRHRRRRRRERHQRVPALQGADLLPHRARPGHRRGAVADLDDRAAGGSQRCLVGRHAALSARGRRRLDPRAATTRTSASSTSARRRRSRGWRRAAA